MAYGLRESTLGPHLQLIRDASTPTLEFKSASLGLRRAARVYGLHGHHHGNALMGEDHLGGYGETGPNGLGDIFADVASLPLIGPAIGAGLQAFQARVTGAALQTVAANPSVQAAAVSAAGQQVSSMAAKYLPWAIGGVALLFLLKRR